MEAKQHSVKKAKACEVQRITRIVSVDASCFNEPLHSNPFVSGLLAKIALLPEEIVAATSVLLRLSLRNDSIGQLVKEAVFEAESGLLDNEPDSYNKEVFFWNGLANGIEIMDSVTEKVEVAA